MRLKSIAGGIIAASLLAACNGAEAGTSVKSASAPEPADTPYASTYKAYPSTPTALVGATIYDGKGGQIENGIVLLSGGKVEAVGSSGLAIPANYTQINARGKFVTPGVIDIHSHLGDYPTPSVAAHSDGNEATSPATPEVWV